MKTSNEDPLRNPRFKAPGFMEKLREALLGASRPIDCVQIEVTSHCPGACTYCPRAVQSANWRARHLSDETFARLWPLLRLSSRAHLQGWGEPLLHPRFFDYAALARKADCLVSTTSCGLVMNEKIAEKIKNSGMDAIAFSFVGTDTISNSPRERVPFEDVRARVKLLRKILGPSGKGAPEIHVAYLMLADRMEAAALLPDLLEDLDAEMAVVSALDYLATPEHKELAFAPDEEKKIAKARKILSAAQAQAEISGRVIHYALPDPSAGARAGGCRENATRTLYVDADGRVSPCVYLNVPGSDGEEKRRVFGDVSEEDPLQIWRKPEYRAFRASLRSGSPEGPCVGCPKRREIAGAARALS